MIRDGFAQCLRCSLRHDLGTDVVIEREHGNGRLPDREGRSRDDGRQQSFEAFPRSGQFRGNTRRLRMHFGTDMMGDQTHDPLAVLGGEMSVCIAKPGTKLIDP